MKKIFIVFLVTIMFLGLLIPISASGENDLYSYNGIELPEVQNWDKTVYPYAIVVTQTLFGRLYCYLYLLKDYEYTDIDVNNRKLDFTTDLYYFVSYRPDEPATEWGKINEEEVTKSEHIGNIKWANFDIMNADGSVKLSASDPVLVGGEIGPEHNTDTCYVTDNNCDNICDVCSRTIIDATENNRIMPTNRYLIEENPAMPDYTFYQTYHNTSTLNGIDALCLFLVDIDTGLETRIAVPVKGVLVTPQEIKYYVDDQWLTVYKGVPLADAGWINDSYRMITFIDAKVTNDFKQFFFNQSLKKPNYSNYYEFCDKGIAYNGEFVARYENDDTPRVDWSNNYVVIYEYNEKLYIAQSFDYMQFGKVDGYDAIRLHDYSTYDYWVIDDEKIEYMGVAQSFTPDALLAGNETIINWSDSTTYHYFDTGIRAFFGDESIFDEEEEIDPDATWLERILYKVVEIREKINSIPKMIIEGIKNTIEQLFVPDQEYITTKTDYLFEQFNFLTIINNSMNYVKEYLLSKEFNEPPVIEINLGLAESDYYWGGNVVALDMTWYAKYKPTVDAFLSAWIWLIFIYQLFTRLPNIVSGVAGDFKTIMTPAGKINKNSKNNGKGGNK